MEGCTTRTHSAGLCGTLGPHLSLVDLSVVHRFVAFQVAFGNEQRMRPDVSELVYRARAVSSVGRQKALVAPLPDYLRCVPVLGSRFDNGCANCGSAEARRSPAVRRCRSLRHHRRSFARTVTTKTRTARSRHAMIGEISRYHSLNPRLTGGAEINEC